MLSTSPSLYLNELLCEMRHLMESPVELKNSRILLSKEISKVFNEMSRGEQNLSMSFEEPNRFMTPRNYCTSTPISSLPPRFLFSPQSTLPNPFVTPIKHTKPREFGDMKTPINDSQFVLQTKIYIPEPPTAIDGRKVKCNYIGRILGPSGMSARMIESEYDVTLLIRGAGSVKGEEHLRGKKRFEHLKEPLHVLLIARHNNREKCEEILEKAALKVESLLTPVHDDYKEDQLVRFAMMNGTYEERPKKKRQSIGSSWSPLSQYP